MQRHLATAFCFAFVAAGAASASDSAYQPQYDATCFAPVATYEAGLPAVSAEGVSAQAQIEKLTDNFSAMVKAISQAQSCYEGAMAGASGAEALAIRTDANQVGRIFRQNYGQYETAMETLTAAAMGEIAPAAGGDGDQIGMDSAMEAVTNSMFVMEWAQKSLERQAKLEKASAQTPE